MGLIPAGARDIRVQEVAEAANFLALRDPASDRYFLNGGWTIQWAGDYPAAGTTFTYARAGDWENLTAPGPTLKPLWIQVGASWGGGMGRRHGAEGCPRAGGRCPGRVADLGPLPAAPIPGDQPGGPVRVHGAQGAGPW